MQAPDSRLLHAVPAMPEGDDGQAMPSMAAVAAMQQVRVTLLCTRAGRRGALQLAVQADAKHRMLDLHTGGLHTDELRQWMCDRRTNRQEWTHLPAQTLALMPAPGRQQVRNRATC
jgi:hypothetical protein